MNKNLLFFSPFSVDSADDQQAAGKSSLFL